MLEFGVIDAAGHETAAGLALLTAEALAGTAVYAAVLFDLVPARAGEFRSLLRVARRGSAAEADETLAVEAELDAAEQTSGSP